MAVARPRPVAVPVTTATLFASFTRLLSGPHKVGEEVVALVIDHDKGREVLDLNLPNGLHAQLRVLQNLDLADAVLGQPCGRSADSQEMERPSCTAVARSILCRSSRDTCPIFLVSRFLLAVVS